MARQSSYSAEKPKKFTLAEPKGGPGLLVFYLDGNRLVSPTIVQEFDDPEDASEHLERVLQVRKKAGWVMKATESVSDAVVEKAIDDIDEAQEGPKKKRKKKSGLEMSLEQGRLTVTFTDTSAETSELFARIKRDRVNALHLRCDPVLPGDAWAREVSNYKFPSVTSFIFDTESKTPIQQARFTIGDLSKTFASFPNLQRAFFSGASAISTSRHDLLKELTLLGEPLDHDRQLAGLCRSHFPLLDRLVIGLCVETEPIDGAQIVESLVKLDAPALSKLEISGLANVPQVLEGLSKAFGDLKVLSLKGSVDEDELLRCVEAQAPRLTKIETLALSCEDEISEEGLAAVKKLLPRLRDTNSRENATLPEAYASW